MPVRSVIRDDDVSYWAFFDVLGSGTSHTEGDAGMSSKRLALWGEELFWSREEERRGGLAPENHAELALVRRGFEPCLLAVLRLSLGTAPDTRVSDGWFRQALARTGHLARAAESAYAIDDEAERSEELLALVKAAAGAEDLCAAQELAEAIPVRQVRDRALVALVPAWALAGERDRAVAVAGSVRYPHNWGVAWALLAKASADRGDVLDALGFAGRADAEASSAGFDGTGEVLALLVEVADAVGDQVRAALLADRVEDFARSHRSSSPGPWGQPGPLAVVLAREALRGDLDRVDALLRGTVGAGGGGGGGLGGDHSGGQGVAPQTEPDTFITYLPVPRSPLGALDTARVLDAVAGTAAQDVALGLADRAEALLDTVVGLDRHDLLRSLVLLLARHGEVERAMALADRIDSPVARAGQQAEIVGQLARYGDTERAETLARGITDRRAQARALIDVVRELARRGDPDQAEAVAHSITDRWAEGEALIAVVREVGRRGDPDRAEVLARSIVYRATRDRALVALAELSDPPRARRLAAQVMVLDGWVPALPLLERLAPRALATVADHAEELLPDSA
ncbi:hypothetical protein OG407_42455 [Streptomyces sp. NBC_01515]|uniref:hypothetical protein n=1 Tax=Streptomyces sp. NBC_01515 TaxID=2903890 RepID=UPI0038667D45